MFKKRETIRHKHGHKEGEVIVALPDKNGHILICVTRCPHASFLEGTYALVNPKEWKRIGLEGLPADDVLNRNLAESARNVLTNPVSSDYWKNLKNALLDWDVANPTGDEQ